MNEWTALDYAIDQMPHSALCDFEISGECDCHVSEARGELQELRRVAGELATDAHALGVAVYDLFDEMATDHSIDIGDVEPKLQSAYGALAEALAAWDALTNGGAK
jgi:hypothetical protein